MKDRIRRIRKFLSRHQEVIAVGMITIPVIYVQREGIRSLNTFLAERNLLNEYYKNQV